MANNSPRNSGNRPPKVVSEANQSVATVSERFTRCNTHSYTDFFYGISIFDLYKPEDLLDIVEDPMAHHDVVREISWTLYGTNGTYTNVVDYMTSMPTLSKIVIPHGKSEKKRTYNKELMLSTLRTIRDKEIVRDALFKSMIEGEAFYYFETTSMPTTNKKTLTDYDVNAITEINELGINASVISLPDEYTRIVGRKNSSYVIAFNLDYFTTGTGESIEKKLRKYPKEIREAYKNRQKNKTLGDNGNWVVLDNDHTIVNKIRSEMSEPHGRPLVLAAIADILYRDYFTNTKRNVLDDINNRIIYQTFPEGKDKGTSALTKQQQENQHNAVKGAVLKKNNKGGISFFSVAAGTKIGTLETGNTDIFDDKNETSLDNKIALALGFAGNALSGSGSGSYSAQESNLELVTSQLFQWVEQIQAELNKVINACIIKDSRNYAEVQYLPITHLNKKQMVGFMKELYIQGSGSISMWVASTGISPDAWFAILDEEIDNNVYEKYKPHATSYNTSGDQGGRPKTDNPTDRTVASRNNNGNSMPSPSDR